MHDERLLTVFSASRYCGRGTNRGAYVVFHPSLGHVVQQFVAAPLERCAPSFDPPSNIPEARLREFEMVTAVSHGVMANLVIGHEHLSPAVDDKSSERQDEAIRRMIMERVVLKKSDLYFYWSKVDKLANCNGKLTKSQWAEGMRNVLGFELPWLNLAATLCDIDIEGKLSYAKFLDRYRIAMRESDLLWMEGIIERACSQLFTRCHTLEAAYKYFDTDGSGEIGKFDH